MSLASFLVTDENTSTIARP